MTHLHPQLFDALKNWNDEDDETITIFVYPLGVEPLKAAGFEWPRTDETPIHFLVDGGQGVYSPTVRSSSCLGPVEPAVDKLHTYRSVTFEPAPPSFEPDLLFRIVRIDTAGERTFTTIRDDVTA